MANLPGAYKSPGGCILLARFNDLPVGCVALRKISEGICEMKRLYVQPQFREKGVGKILADSVIEEARRIGYRQMRLDTVPAMKSARALYESLGFVKIPAYRYNPIEGATFMELDLKQPP